MWRVIATDHSPLPPRFPSFSGRTSSPNFLEENFHDIGLKINARMTADFFRASINFFGHFGGGEDWSEIHVERLLDHELWVFG